MFSRVLAPLDGSTLATSVLPHVASLSRPGGDVLLLGVVEQPPGSPLVDALEWRVRRDVAKVYLDQVAARLQAEVGLAVSVLVEEGCAAERILGAARDQGCDLIALCSHGTSGLNAWNLNTVAFKVALQAGVSVLIVRGYRQGPGTDDAPLAQEAYRSLLVPLDGSLRAEHVLPVADELAEAAGARLLLAHVVQPPRFVRGSSGRRPEALAQAIDEGSHEARAYLEEIASGLRAATEVRVLTDHGPASALHQLAAEEDVDLVVLSAHGHSGQRFWPYGNLATSFILHGSTALLVLQDVHWDVLVPSQAELSATSAPAPSRHPTSAAPPQAQSLAMQSTTEPL